VYCIIALLGVGNQVQLLEIQDRDNSARSYIFLFSDCKCRLGGLLQQGLRCYSWIHEFSALDIPMFVSFGLMIGMVIQRMNLYSFTTKSCKGS
jgi:hypothetical protein